MSTEIAESPRMVWEEPIHIRFGARDAERAGQMQTVKPAEIDVAAIHDIDGASLGEQQIECVDVNEFLFLWRVLSAAKAWRPLPPTHKDRFGFASLPERSKFSRRLRFGFPLSARCAGRPFSLALAPITTGIFETVVGDATYLHYQNFLQLTISLLNIEFLCRPFCANNIGKQLYCFL